MKYFIYSLFVVLFTCSNCVSASHADGTISELFVDQDGAVALKLHEGFKADLVSAECPDYNGFAGNTNADPAMKSSLLAAFAADHKVRLCITGCQGSWLKITCIYSTK